MKAVYYLVTASFALSGCSHSTDESPSIYFSIDKNTVLIVRNGYSYLGTSDYPKSSEPERQFGSLIKRHNVGGSCINFSGLRFAKIGDEAFKCDGAVFTKKKLSSHLLRYASICWDYRAGKCLDNKISDIPAMKIEYDMTDSGDIINIYLAGYDNKNRSNTLILSSSNPIRIN